MLRDKAPIISVHMGEYSVCIVNTCMACIYTDVKAMHITVPFCAFYLIPT